MRIKGIPLPGGGKCYTGPHCRKHSTQIFQARENELRNKINTFLASRPAPPTVPTGIQHTLPPQTTQPWGPPRTLTTEEENFYKSYGIQHLQPANFHPTHQHEQHIEIPSGDQNTRITVRVNHNPYAPENPRKTFIIWMFKNNQPISMLRIMVYPTGHPQPSDPNHTQNVPAICDIEVRPEYRGKKYGYETIKRVEKYMLNGQKIHSGGSYTPEGAAALGGLLPYTEDAKNVYSRTGEELAEGKIPSASYRSMNFVHDWNKLQTEH